MMLIRLRVLTVSTWIEHSNLDFIKQLPLNPMRPFLLRDISVTLDLAMTM